MVVVANVAVGAKVVVVRGAKAVVAVEAVVVVEASVVSVAASNLHCWRLRLISLNSLILKSQPCFICIRIVECAEVSNRLR